MRHFIEIVETASGDSVPRRWVHGGPPTLQGGAFMRNGRNGRDMGGIFLAAADQRGFAYAVGYATARYPGKKGRVYFCEVALADNEILDFTDEAKRNRLAAVTPGDFMADLLAHVQDGQLRWLKTPAAQQAMETYALQAGFGAVIFHEEDPSGVTSICVFDPARVKVLDSFDKETARRIGLGEIPLPA